MVNESTKGTTLEVFLVFLRLGCMSFGGPVAHLGYFQNDLVLHREWCDEETYAEIVALAQSLPGPSSSQVCFGLGLLRAGWVGGIVAWTAFMLPSALLMLAFASGATRLSGPFAGRAIHGLQLVAVAIVAQAVATMQPSLAPDRTRIAVAVTALAIVIFGPPHFATLLAILVGGLAGVMLFRSTPLPAVTASLGRISREGAIVCATLFFALLVLLPAWSHLNPALSLQILSAFYTSGALVFGGGHVVLPLLENAFVSPGWVKEAVFLSGYGAAQALPGPLFTFGVFLGASIEGSSNRVLFGLLGLVGLSAPGLLAMGAILPFWQRWRELRLLRCALWGINAAVVGVLGAALYFPLWTSSVHRPGDFFIVMTAFVLLTQWRLPPILIVGITVACSLAGIGS